ncbi:MAG: tetratricopeptide repeat protein [Pyrinomonadaceae bacterium]|nr:tetratricopeptide repeat protein [Pyrinomonadaceae bacterium]
MSYHLVLAVFFLAAVEAGVSGSLSAAQTSTPNSRADQAARLVAEGVAALERSDRAAAASLFQRALSLKPNDAAAHTYLGVLADGAGDLAAAESHFAAAAAAEPSSPSARNNLGAVLLKRGFPKQAAEQFEASIRLDKNQPNALFNLAQIRFSGGTPNDLRAARELFARAYSLTPDAEGGRALVVVSLRLGEREAAAKYYGEYTQRFLTGTGAVTTGAVARADLGAALLEAGLLKEAEAELTAAIMLEPSDQASVLRLARVFLAGKNLPAAGKTLEAAVARGLDAAPIYALLASVYEQSGHIENAIPAMRLAIQRDPQSETYRFAYGMLLTNLLAPKAAVIRLKEALDLFPRSARLWFALGIAHFKDNRNDEAAKAFARSIEIDPQFAPPFAYLGMTYVEVGQYEEAIRSYEHALAVNDKLGVVDYLIAEVLLKEASPDHPRIEAHLARAVKLEPSFAPARLALGKVYARTNRLNEASSELEHVIQLDPNLAEAYYQLGRVYSRQKRTSEAQTTMATFKRLSEKQKEQEMNNRREIVRKLATVLF